MSRVSSHRPVSGEAGKGDVDSNQTAADFQSTMWSLVLTARGDREHFERLLRLYWSPVYSFIRRQGFTGHDASDLTQEFMTRVVLGRDLFGKADPTRGRFRAFLKQSLRNFLVDQHRAGKARKAATAPGAEPVSDAAANLAAPDEFDRTWAASVVDHALRRLEEECLRDGMEPHWRAFELNILGPAIRKTQPVSMEALARVVGAVDADQASNMVQTVKRRFRRTLREVVADTVRDPALVDAELAELRAMLGG